MRKRACGTFLAAKSEATLLRGQAAQGRTAALPSLRAGQLKASNATCVRGFSFCYDLVLAFVAGIYFSMLPMRIEVEIWNSKMRQPSSDLFFILQIQYLCCFSKLYYFAKTELSQAKHKEFGILNKFVYARYG